MFQAFDGLRMADGQDPITALDNSVPFSPAKHTRGDVASALIYACALADAQALADDIRIVAVTGNSMGWYIALAAGGAVSAESGFRIVNTMGTLMQDNMIGGQLIYPFVDEGWVDNPAQKQALLANVHMINDRPDHILALSIDLGGMLVLAGNDAGLAAFETEVPALQGRFPMRLPNHAAFHTDLQAPVAAEGQRRLPAGMFGQPDVPLIDGRGHVWWPHATDPQALWDYTFGHQVTQAYDFTRAVQTAAREFAPDLFIVTGPGSTLGGAVAQSLILGDWTGMATKADFMARQDADPLLVSMGLAKQRNVVAKQGMA